MEQRFDSWLARRGETITIVKRTAGAADSYGDKTYTETNSSVKAFTEKPSLSELTLQGGTVEQADIVFCFDENAAVDSYGDTYGARGYHYEVSWLGQRYKLIGTELTNVVRRIRARRKVE